MNNTRGHTLLELLAVLTIMGILATMSVPFLTMFSKKIAQANAASNKLSTLLAQPAPNCVPAARVVPITSKCTLLDGVYYGYTTDNNVLKIYTDSKCSAELGTLDRVSNETWFNETTNSSWLVFQNGTMKLAVVKYQ